MGAVDTSEAGVMPTLVKSTLMWTQKMVFALIDTHMTAIQHQS